MKPLFAGRIQGLVQSDIRRMSRECAAVNGVNLGQGICDPIHLVWIVNEIARLATNALTAKTPSGFSGS